METYNTSAEDIKEFAEKADLEWSSTNQSNIYDVLSYLKWHTEETHKMIFYLAKRIDDLSDVTEK